MADCKVAFHRERGAGRAAADPGAPRREEVPRGWLRLMTRVAPERPTTRAYDVARTVNWQADRQLLLLVR